MPILGLQVLGTSVIVPRRAVANFALWVFVSIHGGCDCAPARSKPWRHAPEPTADLVPSTIGQVLAGEKDRLAALAGRGDTFSIWLDSDPRTLIPMVDPTEWTLRITQGTVFETLLVYRAGEDEQAAGGYLPGLARTWKVVDGGRA